MAYIRPASQFCCGFKLESGVTAVLLLNLQRNLFFLFICFMTVIAKSDTFSYGGSKTIQVLLAGFALAGLPFILAALWGVYSKAEAPIRLYFFYQLLSFALDMAVLAKEFIFKPPCEHIPSIVAQSGQAFACGAARGFNGITVFALVSIEVYLIFTVFSYCEDLATGGSGPNLSDLHMEKARRRSQFYNTVMSMGDYGYYDCGTTYDRYSMSGLGGSQPLFGSRRHDTEYPPTAF